MPWGVRLTLAALRQLFGLTIREAEVVSFNLFRVAEDPLALSLPSTLEDVLGQEYRFRHIFRGVTADFTIVFRYDEQRETLLVAAIERQAVSQ